MFYHSDTCTASLTAALESRNADQQVNGRKDINYIDTAGFCYATEEKNEMITLVGKWVKLETIILSKISQT